MLKLRHWFMGFKNAEDTIESICDATDRSASVVEAVEDMTKLNKISQSCEVK